MRAGQYGSSVPHWYQKYAWGLKFLQWGYSVAFFETGKPSLKFLILSLCFNTDLIGRIAIHCALLPGLLTEGIIDEKSCAQTWSSSEILYHIATLAWICKA